MLGGGLPDGSYGLLWIVWAGESKRSGEESVIQPILDLQER